MNPFAKIRAVILIWTCFALQNVNGQEYHGDNNLDLHGTSIWNIDDTQLFKITDAFPYQYLIVSEHKFYLMTAVQDFEDSTKIKLTYIRQSDWLSYDAGKPIISKSISDQDDQNLAWEKNRKKVIEIINNLDLSKSINYEYINQGQGNSSWLGESKERIYHIEKEKLSVFKYTGKKQKIAIYKNKFFDGKYIRAQKRFKTEAFETFFFIEGANDGFVFRPNRDKFDKNDLYKINGTFNRGSKYLFANWTSSISIDLIELSDTGVYLLPDVTSQNNAPKIVLSQISNLSLEFNDNWNSAELKDFNNDRRLDLILYGESPVVILNKPGNKVRSYQLSKDRLDPYGLSCADADGDNDLDVFVDGYDGLRIFLNDAGQFNRAPIRIGNDYHPFFFLIDLDEDGDKDLLSKKGTNKIMYAEFENGIFKEEEEFMILK